MRSALRGSKRDRRTIHPASQGPERSPGADPRRIPGSKERKPRVQSSPIQAGSPGRTPFSGSHARTIAQAAVVHTSPKVTSRVRTHGQGLVPGPRLEGPVGRAREDHVALDRVPVGALRLAPECVRGHAGEEHVLHERCVAAEDVRRSCVPAISPSSCPTPSRRGRGCGSRASTRRFVRVALASLAGLVGVSDAAVAAARRLQVGLGSSRSHPRGPPNRHARPARFRRARAPSRCSARCTRAGSVRRVRGPSRPRAPACSRGRRPNARARPGCRAAAIARATPRGRSPRARGPSSSGPCPASARGDRAPSPPPRPAAGASSGRRSRSRTPRPARPLPRRDPRRGRCRRRATPGPRATPARPRRWCPTASAPKPAARLPAARRARPAPASRMTVVPRPSSASRLAGDVDIELHRDLASTLLAAAFDEQRQHALLLPGLRLASASASGARAGSLKGARPMPMITSPTARPAAWAGPPG